MRGTTRFICRRRLVAGWGTIFSERAGSSRATGLVGVLIIDSCGPLDIAPEEEIVNTVKLVGLVLVSATLPREGR